MPQSPPIAVTLPAHVAAMSTIPSTDVAGAPPEALDDGGFGSRYVVGTVLGEGGMGVVRTCVDHRIGRDVAIKSVKPSRAGTGDVARFLREACVQGQLEHPAIVPVYDLGRDPQGLLYFTMKRVRGVTFERIVDALRAREPDAVRQFPRRKLLTAFASVCHAVDFVHAHGVVHRDLKPGNVMLGDYGEVYVLDWGLAKIVAEDDRLSAGGDAAVPSPAGESSALTVQGTRMGTPGYMPPEQARGEAVDARSDVYALGVLLFELLALEPLHPGDTPQVALDSTLAGIDARPSVRAPHLDLPPELDAVCVRATAVDPGARFASVRELVDALERYLDGDRDIERRRTLAEEHARAAVTHAKAAIESGASAMEARRRALRELGRAIALDPTNEDAVHTLMHLMTTPPRAMPVEAREAIEVDGRLGVQTGARWAAPAYLSWFLYLPLMLWMGVRSWTAWGVCSAAWIVAAVVAWDVARRPPRTGSPPPMLTFSGAVAVATTATICGPYMLVPTIAALGSLLIHMAPGRAARVPGVVAYCVAFGLPALLQWMGLLPASYVFAHDSLTIAAGMLYFPPAPTQAFLLVSNVAVIASAAVLMARFRNTLVGVEERLHVQAWQLRQLVPEQVHAASTGPLPRAESPAG
jgi:hypothetical protein